MYRRMSAARGWLGAPSGTGVFHQDSGVNARKGAPSTTGAGFQSLGGSGEGCCSVVHPLTTRDRMRTPTPDLAAGRRRRPDRTATEPPLTGYERPQLHGKTVNGPGTEFSSLADPATSVTRPPPAGECPRSPTVPTPTCPASSPAGAPRRRSRA